MNTYGYVYQNPLYWYDSDGFEPKKYEKSKNPSKRKTHRSGTGTKKGDAGRERNKGFHGEEHSKRAKGNRPIRGKQGGSVKLGHLVKGGIWWWLIENLINNPVQAPELDPGDTPMDFGSPNESSNPLGDKLDFPDWGSPDPVDDAINEMFCRQNPEYCKEKEQCL